MHKFFQPKQLVMAIKGIFLAASLMLGAVQAQEYTRGTKVLARLVDSFSGAVVTTIDGRINFDSDAPLTDNVSQPIANGQVQAALVGGVSYRAAIDFKNTVGEALFDREGNDYIIENPVIRFKSPSKGLIVIDYMVRPAKASLSVTVVTPTSGQLLTGYVSAVSAVARHRVEAPFSGSTPVKLPVIEDSAYVVRVLANSGSSLVAPPEERLIASSGKTTSYQAVFLLPDHTLTVTPNVGEAIEGFICMADAADGSLVVGRTINSTTQELPISRSVASWNITCRGNSETVQYRGSTSYTVPATERATLAVELRPRGTFFAPVSVIVPPTDPVIVVGPDNTTKLEVPAESFPAGSTVKVTIKSGIGFTESSSFSPLSAFDIKITVNDVPTTIVDKPITIVFPIDDALLDEFGALPEDLYPARFDETSQIWVREDSFVYDKESKTIRVTVSHFSIWGLLVDLLKTLTTEVPSNTKAKPPAKKSTKGWKRARPRSVQISWEVPEGEKGPYQVQFLRVKRRVKPGEPYIVPTDWTEARTYTAEENKLTVRRPAGIYIFRVKIATSENYSEETRFTVK